MTSFYEIVQVYDRGHGRTSWVVEQDGVPVQEYPDLPAALRGYRRLRHLNEDNPIIFGERKS
jgi:hypothetical protein